MRFIIDIAIGVLIATVLGLSSAWFVLDRGIVFGAVKVGEWVAAPATDGSADPYTVASLARSARIPLGAGEGIAFTAETDHAGAPLSGACRYRLSGQTPAARLWTLTAYDGQGRLMANAAHRTAFQSREILRHPDGTFDIAIGPEVEPGNWLPVARVDHFKLVLRLYDTPVTTGNQLSDLSLPTIVRESC